MAQHASTAVALAALAMMAPAIVPGTASAQQVAANAGSEFAKCDAMSETRPKEAIVCRVEVLKAKGAAADTRAAAADERSAAADAEIACGQTIKAEVQAGRISPEAVRATLAGRKTRDVGACNLLGQLTRS